MGEIKPNPSSDLGSVLGELGKGGGGRHTHTLRKVDSINPVRRCKNLLYWHLDPSSQLE